MNRKERMQALLRGKDYDRPPFNFYEITALDQIPRPDDPYCIYNDPSWAEIVNLAWEKSDIILLRGPSFIPENSPVRKKTLFKENTEQHIDEKGSLYTTYTLEIDGRTLTRRTRRDPDVDTVWTLEHLLKDKDDLLAWMKLPDTGFCGIDDTVLQRDEARLGNRGIVALDWGDALCCLASLFSMEDFTVMALTEEELFTAALDKIQKTLLPKYKAAALYYPGRLWRIYGPEYAGVPYLPPRLYDAYVVKYDAPAMAICRESGGCPRIHQHGFLKDNLDSMIRMGAWGTDPVEPPHQGNVTLQYIREKYGDSLVLFGNLEANDIETLSPDEFEEKVLTALREGPNSKGQGFVLQASASPYGRKFSRKALANYRRWVAVMERLYPGTL